MIDLALDDTPTDAALIDELGVPTIAEALDMTPSGIRNWRSRGIPDNRRGELLSLLARRRGNNAHKAAQDVSQLTRGVPLATQGVPGRPDVPSLQLFMPSGPQGEKRYADALIAGRQARLAERHAERAEAEAGGLPPVLPVRGYAARLLLLFALDFPVLTMAFVTVTQVSPIVAAGSAVALSLFLVLGAHALGGPLRDIARHLPAWAPSLISVAVIGMLLASVIWTTIDLRLKGFEIDVLTATLTGGDLVFGGSGSAALVLPPEIQWAITRAAALVTILATTFGIGWSYQRHAPQAVFARAERAYARALKAQAKAISRLRLGDKGASAAAVMSLAVGLLLPGSAEAATCDGETVMAFIDGTTAYDDEDRAVIMPAIETMAASLLPDQRLVIRTVRDRAPSSRILFDRCVPRTDGIDWSFQGFLDWLVSSPAEARVERATFFDDMKRVLVPELQATSAASKTALVETLGHGIRAEGEGSIAAIWMFSDLLESAALTATDLLTDSKRLEAAAASTFPPLGGAKVHVAGIGRFHDVSRRPLTSIERGTLVDSWSGLIGSAGGQWLVAP